MKPGDAFKVQSREVVPIAIKGQAVPYCSHSRQFHTGRVPPEKSDCYVIA